MGIVLVRVDDRLVHGQVVEAWASFCNATRIIVANDEANKNRVQRLAIESCSSKALSIKVEGIEELLKDTVLHTADENRVIIIFANLNDLMQAQSKGFRFSYVNIGNLHHNGECKTLTSSVYIDKSDEDILHKLLRSGIEVDIRAMPSDKKAAVSF